MKRDSAMGGGQTASQSKYLQSLFSQNHHLQSYHLQSHFFQNRHSQNYHKTMIAQKLAIIFLLTGFININARDYDYSKWGFSFTVRGTPEELIQNNQVNLNFSKTNTKINTKDYVVDSQFTEINGYNNNHHIFINYGVLRRTTDTGGGGEIFTGVIMNFDYIINHGIIGNSVWLENNTSGNLPNLLNFGITGGYDEAHQKDFDGFLLNNLGIILINKRNTDRGDRSTHFQTKSDINIINYHIQVNEKADFFNTTKHEDNDHGNGYTHTNATAADINSHLLVSQTDKVHFVDSNSKILLSIGGDFEIGKDYLISHLIQVNKDFSDRDLIDNIDAFRLTTKDNWLEVFTNDNHTFTLKPNGAMSEVAITQKANIKTINSLMIQSDEVIFKDSFYNAKSSPKSNIKTRSIKRLSSLNSIADNATFFYNNHSDSSNAMDLAFYISDAREQRAKRASNLNKRANPRNNTQSTSTNNNASTQQSTKSTNDNLYFAFMPYVSYNDLGKQNRYKLAGLEYGFISAFSGKINPSNALGIHLGFSYDKYSDTSKYHYFKDFHIKSMNIMGGLNYKLDLIYGMYLKARIDAFYFMNDIANLPYYYNISTKFDNLAFGGSVYYGKDFDFNVGGVLGVSLGLDYKALKQLKTVRITDSIQLKNDVYRADLYHLPYIDAKLKYNKYFDFGLGLNASLGIRANPAFNAMKGNLVIYDDNYYLDYAAKRDNTGYARRSIDFNLDSDIFLGYVNVGLNYKLLDMMDFSINYSGNFGNKSMSNAGNFAFKIWW